MKTRKLPKSPNSATKMSVFLPLGILGAVLVLLIALGGALLISGGNRGFGVVAVVFSAFIFLLLPVLYLAILVAAVVPCFRAFLRREPARFYSLILPVLLVLLATYQFTPGAKSWIVPEPPHSTERTPATPVKGPSATPLSTDPTLTAPVKARSAPP